MKSQWLKVHYPTKTITVTGKFFWPSQVLFKIRASYSQWQSWHIEHIDPSKTVSISSVFDHLSRPKKDHIDQLKRYADEEPEDFLWEFYYNFLRLAYFVSPLSARRSRRLFHNIPTLHFNYIKISAQWLYILLEYWKKVPKYQWPIWLNDFVKTHELTLNPKANTAWIVTDAIMSLFGIDLGDYENFYHDHIRSNDIKKIRGILETLEYIPRRYPLSVLFENITPQERLNRLTGANP